MLQYNLRTSFPQAVFLAWAVFSAASPSLAQQLEVGTVTVSTNWTFVQTSQSYVSPVVVGSLATAGATTDAAIQVGFVTSNSFRIRQIVTSTANPFPPTQEVGWIVVEAGTHTVGSTTIAAGLVHGVNSLLGTSPGNFVAVSLPAGFGSAPAILGATQSTFGGLPDDFIVARARNVTATDFEIGFQREESLYNFPHGTETVGWIAWETGTETVGDWVVTAAVTPDAITHVPSTFAFGGFDPGTQLADGSVFGLLSGFDGADPAWVAGFAPSGTSIDIYVDEEESSDGETAHTPEVVSLLALSPAPLPPAPVPSFGPAPFVALVATIAAMGSVMAARRQGQA